MTRKRKNESEHYRALALTAARDLGYDYEVISKIKTAQTDSEIDRIMRNARLEKFK